MTCFLVLLTRVLVSFKYNLLIPISYVDQNMERCQKRNAIQEQRFFFRTNLSYVACDTPRNPAQRRRCGLRISSPYRARRVEMKLWVD